MSDTRKKEIRTYLDEHYDAPGHWHRELLEDTPDILFVHPYIPDIEVCIKPWTDPTASFKVEMNVVDQFSKTVVLHPPEGETGPQIKQYLTSRLDTFIPVITA